MPAMAPWGAEELRHRNTAEVDHYTAQQGEHQRIFEHCPQLDVLFVPGKLCLAVGPLQSIQQGYKACCVEHGFSTQHCCDQRKSHEPGVGKATPICAMGSLRKRATTPPWKAAAPRHLPQC